MALGEYVRMRHLGRVLLAEFQMKSGPGLPGREPDILFVATDHLDRLNKTWLDGPGDLVVEIISPESFSRDRGEKFAEYEQAGVPEYWVIDPLRRRVEFYQRAEDGYYRTVSPDADGVYHSAAIDGLWLRVDWIWDRPLLVEVLREWGLLS
jgi:Uma2 family endonuclease